MGAGRLVGSLIGAMGGGALGGMLGGSTGRMIGSMAGSMLAGRGVGGLGGGGGGGGLGGLLGGLMGGNDDEVAAAAEAIPDDEAMVLLKAMCNAAKSDGHVDDDEVNAIVERAGDLSGDDEAMLRAELSAPLDTASFVASVPKGMENEVYAASLLAIEVDTIEEAEYLKTLASGLGITHDTVAEIHKTLGV